MREIKVKDNGYGCFTAFFVCTKCGKELFKENFSFSNQHIGIGDKDTIMQYMDDKAKKKEVNFCFKCGTKMAESETI